jgi:iron-sulfur cluster assembly protein
MITVTEAAAKQIHDAAKQQDMGGMALRIAATRKPDGSIDYAMGFDELKDVDIRIPVQDVDVVIAPAYKDLLEGMTLDYVEMEPGDFRFIFMNPNDPHFEPPKKKKHAP